MKFKNDVDDDEVKVIQSTMEMINFLLFNLMTTIEDWRTERNSEIHEKKINRSLNFKVQM